MSLGGPTYPRNLIAPSPQRIAHLRDLLSRNAGRQVMLAFRDIVTRDERLQPRTSDLATRTEHSHATVLQAMTRAERVGLVERIGGGPATRWQLTTDGRAFADQLAEPTS